MLAQVTDNKRPEAMLHLSLNNVSNLEHFYISIMLEFIFQANRTQYTCDILQGINNEKGCPFLQPDSQWLSQAPKTKACGARSKPLKAIFSLDLKAKFLLVSSSQKDNISICFYQDFVLISPE